MKRKIIPYNPILKERANALRNNMTYSEVILWNYLKDFKMMGYDFDRQKPLLNYIADFFSKDLNLVIEVDGITHNDEVVFEKDMLKDEQLNKYGITVIRINALDIIDKKNYALQIIENWIVDYELKNGVGKSVEKRRMKK